MYVCDVLEFVDFVLEIYLICEIFKIIKVFIIKFLYFIIKCDFLLS